MEAQSRDSCNFVARLHQVVKVCVTESIISDRRHAKPAGRHSGKNLACALFHRHIHKVHQPSPATERVERKLNSPGSSNGAVCTTLSCAGSLGMNRGATMIRHCVAPVLILGQQVYAITLNLILIQLFKII